MAIVDNPYSRWASLEAEALSSGQYEQSDSSNVIRVFAADAVDSSSSSGAATSSNSSSTSVNNGVRIGRILTMLSSTLYASDDEVATTEIAAIMAVRDFNLRRWRDVYEPQPAASVTHATNTSTEISGNETSCNFYLTLGLARPIGNNVQDWARQFLDRVLFHGMLRNGSGGSDNSLYLFNVTTLRPMAVLGGTTREAAVMLAQLGSVSSPRGVSSSSQSASALDREGWADEGVMVMSPVASTTYLDDIPMFMRTVTTTRPFAQTLCRYLRSIGVRFLGVFYSNDVLGTSYLLDLKVAAASNGIEITPISYDATLGLASLDDDVDWSVTISKLDSSEILYYFGVLTADSWVQVITRLHRSELLGANSDRVWFFDRTLLAGLSGLELHMDNSTQSDLVLALNRSAIVDFEASSARNIEIHAESFQQTLADPDFVDYWDGLRSRGGYDRPVSLETFTPQPNIYSMLAYDAVMAMGLGACQTADQDLIRGGDLMNQTTYTQFFGATGDVRFKSFGTREPDGLIFRISNLFFQPAHDSADFLEVDHVPCYQFNVHSNESAVLRNLTFPSGSTTPPPVTEATGENTNPVPVGVSVVSFVLAATVILLSLAFGAWTTLRRNSPQVRASQPVFLVLVCFGTLMIGISITLSAIQYISPTSTCMVYTWLFALGVSLVFAALFAKTWRIHRVFKSATRFRRVEIRAKDVLWPIVVICGLEVAVLTAWTVRV
jgi:7 transmembrane sweet-taste receptor of 3 GCPR/Receptor family ligand binding region